MPGQQQRKGSHGHESGQHRQHLHNPTGYTDEVADEEREFMMQAERSAVCSPTPFNSLLRTGKSGHEQEQKC